MSDFIASAESLLSIPNELLENHDVSAIAVKGIVKYAYLLNKENQRLREALEKIAFYKHKQIWSYELAVQQMIDIAKQALGDKK